MNNSLQVPNQNRPKRTNSWYERMKEATVSSIKAMGYNTSQTDETSEDDYLEKRRLLPPIDASELVETERLARRLHSAKPRAKLSKGKPIMDYFVVVGLPSENSHTPGILWSYDGHKKPTIDSSLTKSIEYFAFPEGVLVSKPMNKSQALKAIENDQKETFLFLLTFAEEETGEMQVQYGICVHQTMPIQSKPFGFSSDNIERSDDDDDDDDENSNSESSDSDDTQVTASNNNKEEQWILADRCYAIIATAPVLHIHTRALKALVAKERAYGVSIVNGRNSEKKQLRMTRRAKYFLNRYADVVLPDPGQSIIFAPGHHHPVIHSQRAYVDDEEDALAKYCIPTALQLLGSSILIDVLTALLLEIKVVFVSQSLHHLATLCLAWPPLLQPFVWQSPLVPALPRRLRPLLGAPVPLLCGVLSIDDEVREHLGTDALIVEIQNSSSAQPFATMHWSSGVPAEIIGLPNRAKLVESLTKYHKSLTLTKNPSEHKALAVGVSSAVRQHLDSMLSNFRAACVRDTSDVEHPVSAFVSESFLAAVKSESERAFFEEFFRTQMWSCYTELRLKRQDDMAVEQRHSQLERQHSTGTNNDPRFTDAKK